MVCLPQRARGISSNGTMTHAGIRSCEPVGSGGRHSGADRCGRFACSWCSRSERDGVDGPCQSWFVSSRAVDAVRWCRTPCAASRAVAAVRRCRTLTVARARRRQPVCDCGGRRHCAADCAAPLTCRGSGRSSGGGVGEPELQQRCAAVRCVARGCGGPPVLHAHRRARPQSTTSLRLRRLEAFRRWLRCSAHLSPEFRLLQPLHCGESA